MTGGESQGWTRDVPIEWNRIEIGSLARIIQRNGAATRYNSITSTHHHHRTTVLLRRRFEFLRYSKDFTRAQKSTVKTVNNQLAVDDNYNNYSKVTTTTAAAAAAAGCYCHERYQMLTCCVHWTAGRNGECWVTSHSDHSGRRWSRTLAALGAGHIAAVCTCVCVCSHLMNCEFITRLLYKDIYWHTLLYATYIILYCKLVRYVTCYNKEMMMMMCVFVGEKL